MLGCLGSAGSSAVLRRSSGGAPVLCWHTQQDTAIAVRHEVDRLGAAGSASNESRSLDHLLLMHTLVGAQWRRRTNECSRTGRGPCASRPPSSREHAGGSWPCSRHGLGCGSRRDGPASLHSRPSILSTVPFTCPLPPGQHKRKDERRHTVLDEPRPMPTRDAPLNIVERENRVGAYVRVS